MKVAFVNANGVVKNVKVGYSWTVFCFAGWPFFFRGMVLHGVIFVILSMLSFGFVTFIVGFFANKMTATYYLEHGYTRTGGGWDYANQAWGFVDTTQNKSNV